MRQLTIVLLTGAFLALARPSHADELRVFSSVAARGVVEALAAEFARSTKHTIVPVYGLAGALRTSIEKGEAFDVAILTPALLDELAAKGLVDSAPRPTVGRSGLGFMIKAGGAKPDVSSVDAFKRTVLAARGVTFVATGVSGVAFLATIEKLGIGEAAKPRLKPVASPDDVNAAIASGSADLAVLPVSEIIPMQGMAVGGVFPTEIQTYIVMAAGINAKSPHAAAAREFVAFLTSPRNTALVRSQGMDR